MSTNSNKNQTISQGAHQPAIAIDGPAAAGKTTLGFMLANALNYLFLDTGSMYRAVTLAAMQRGIPVEDETAVADLTRQINLQVLPAVDAADGRMFTVMIDGQDVTWALRDPNVEANVSAVASHQTVRQELVRQQRKIGREGGVVMVGRDIGTVVLPDAPLKLYLVATAEERARRRWEEQKERGKTTTYETILADVQRRDAFDTSRRYAPLRPADDALVLDTSDRPATIILEELLEIVVENLQISVA